jgi:hypothetical protein
VSVRPGRLAGRLPGRLAGSSGLPAGLPALTCPSGLVRAGMDRAGGSRTDDGVIWFCARGTGAGRRDSEDAVVLAASPHVTERDRRLVRLVAEHRVLTTDQLAALGFANITTAAPAALLTGLKVLRRFRPHPETGSAPWHYLLGPVGAALLGAEDRDEKKWAPQVRADRQLALERSRLLAHMTGRNWFFIALHRDADGDLDEWLNEPACADRYAARAGLTVREMRRLANPDRAGTWAEDGREIAFLLEYDTGTENLTTLAGKLKGYGDLSATLAGRDRDYPPLLFCFGSPRREQTARRALAATTDARALRIATTAIDPRLTSPAGPVWFPLSGQAGGQVRLIDLAALPDPWQEARDRQREELAAWHQRVHRRPDSDRGPGTEGTRS